MLAIKKGGNGEEKLKKYEKFEDNVSATGGVLNVSDLIPKFIDRKTTPTSTVIKMEPVHSGDGLATPPNSAFSSDAPSTTVGSLTVSSCGLTFIN